MSPKCHKAGNVEASYKQALRNVWMTTCCLDYLYISKLPFFDNTSENCWNLKVQVNGPLSKRGEGSNECRKKPFPSPPPPQSKYWCYMLRCENILPLGVIKPPSSSLAWSECASCNQWRYKRPPVQVDLAWTKCIQAHHLPQSPRPLPTCFWLA